MEVHFNGAIEVIVVVPDLPGEITIEGSGQEG